MGFSKKLKIGKTILKNRLFLAPMVDVSDLPYRILCRKHGAAIAYTEMLNIGSVLHENKKTLNILKTVREDNPLGVQITGRSEEEFRKIAKTEYIGTNNGFDVVDVNCGCPSTRITGNQSGSYLLQNPDKIGRIIKILVDSGLTVTAKIRIGFKKNNALKVSKAVEKAGAELLTVHARLAVQKSNIPADWKWIKKVRNEAGIPVVGNGGIVDGKTAEEMLDIADGAMIAGAAIGKSLDIQGDFRIFKNRERKRILCQRKNNGIFGIP